MPLDLKSLLAPYREHKRFSLRIETLPQLARLSAGQNNGDNTWSLALDELEELLYFPPEGFDKEHTLAIRLIAKDDSGASTIALLEFRIPSAGDRESASAQPPQPVPREDAPGGMPQDGVLREEILRLETMLAERDAELDRLRASGEQTNAHWRQKIEEALLGAESAWKIDETTRLNWVKASLQEEFEQKLAEAQQRAQADADMARKWEAVVFRRLQQELASTKDMLAERDAEFIQLQEQLERQRQKTEAEISAIQAAAEAAAGSLRDARAAWQREAAKPLADATQRYELAEAALAAARAAAARAEPEAAQLRQELENLRQKSQTDLAGAKEAAEYGAAERLKAAQAQWQEQAAKTQAEMMARCQAAEAALASARAMAPPAGREAELAELHDQLERLRRKSEADISAAKEAAELKASEALAAQTQWQEHAARPLAEMTARCQAAEAALAAAETGADRNADLATLQDQFENLRQKSQADLAAAKEAAERRASERLKAAEAQWQEKAARSLAELAARCQAAETALASARAADAGKPDADAYVRSLNLEIKTLQKALVDREADLASVHVSLEQMRLGITKAAPAAHWQPLPSLGGNDRPERKKPDSHLGREVFIVVVVAIAAILSLPRLESLLPDDLRAQIESVGGLFNSPAQEPPAAPAPAPPPPPKPVHPAATVARSVNMRAQPAVGAAVVASLKRGAEVAILERNGNWVRVEIAGTDGKVQQGWVFGSYLDDPAAPQAKPAIQAPTSQAKAANEVAAPATPASETAASPVSQATEAMPASEAPAAQATPATEPPAPTP